MAVTAHPKIIEGQEARYVDGELFEFVDVVYLRGLSTSATLLQDALNNALCPKPYALYAVGSTLRVVERRATVIDTNAVRVAVTYRRLWVYPDYLRTGSGALETIETSRNSQDPATWTTIQVGPTGKKQCGVVQATMAQQVLRFERIVESDDPAVDQRTFLNKLNDATWYGLAAGRWLCTKLDYEWLAPAGSVTSGGVSPAWKYVYEFTSKAYGWNPLVEWVDPETGKPHPVPTADYWQIVAWYGTANYAVLSLGGT
jgi:hypothetical protein